MLKRLETRGRGKMGIRVHPDSRLSVVLKEGEDTGTAVGGGARSKVEANSLCRTGAGGYASEESEINVVVVALPLPKIDT